MTTLNAQLTRRAFLGGAAAFGAAAMVSPKNAFAEPTSADVQAQADAARVKLNDMRAKLGEASDTYNQALLDHDTAQAKMEEAQAKIDENTAQIATLQGKLGVRARDMYRNGQVSFLDILLDSASFDDLTRNWDALETMNENDASMVQQTKDLRASNEEQHAEYANQAQIAKQKIAEAETAKDQAQDLVNQYQAEVNSLDSQVAEILEEERRAAAEAAEAAARAAALETPPANNAQNNAGQGSAGTGEGAGSNASQGGTSTPSAPAAPENGGSDSGNTGGSTDSGNAGGSSSGGSNSGGSNSGGSSSGGSSSGGNSGGSNAYGSAVVSYAQGQIGVPYVWGGTTPGVGLDCSGLTSYCWQSASGIWIGRTTWAQYASAQWVGSPSEAQPGDVLYSGGHVAIAANYGGSSYIHAPQPGEYVCYSSTSWWNPFYAALRWY